MKEITACRYLNAPSVPKFYGLSFTQNNACEEILFSGYAKGEKLSKCYIDILEECPHLIYTVIIELLSSISFIHHRGIFHGDLSLNNIIVDYCQRKERVKISLIDFGMSGFIENDEIIGLTIEFAAYEIFLRDIKPEYIRKIDIFAIGCILFNIFYRTTLVSILMRNCDSSLRSSKKSVKESVRDLYYSLKSRDQLSQTINEVFSKLPPNRLVSKEMLKLIRSCFEVNPSDRPNAEDIYREIEIIIQKDKEVNI